MKLFVGLALFGAILAFYFYAWPRNGKLASFVGTKWETPLCLGAVCSLAVGVALVVAGWNQ